MQYDPPLKLAILAHESEAAQAARAKLVAQYGDNSLSESDVIVTLGGDGFLLETFHKHQPLDKPIYGMNLGSVGFLLNRYEPEGLLKRICAAQSVELHPLRMIAQDREGQKHEAYALNEVSLLRERHQAAKLRIIIDGRPRLEELICDGILVATPAGSTAYNLSVSGPILPLTSHILALTPISAFRPRRWRGALLPNTAQIRIEILNPEKRPVSAVADSIEIRHVVAVDITEAQDQPITLLFDPEQDLAERIILEQFSF